MLVTFGHLYYFACIAGVAKTDTAVKRCTHARDLRKAREKQRQIEYKGVKS